MLEGYAAKLPTPFAVLGIRTAGRRLTDIEYLPRGVATLEPLDEVAAATCRQIERYLDDPDFRFDLPYTLEGTAYQCRVWTAIAGIARGAVRTYGEVAKALNSGARPVGTACGANRLPLIIPCHRVVAAGGLGGFMNTKGQDALAIKRWLLRHEGVRC